MSEVLILGSGPAAAGAASVLATHPGSRVRVIDVGGTLEPDKAEVLRRLSTHDSSEWSAGDVDALSKLPEAVDIPGLPEKRSFGSDFSFRDFGQLTGVSGSDVNTAVISGAYGGFSNTWGAQVMPFPPTAFDAWPVTYAEMLPHYRSVLRQIPFSAAEDDLAEEFPLLARPQPLPPLAPRTARVHSAYERHHRKLRGLGVTVGYARLAFAADHCIRCGLCMTGCPLDLIYSSRQTFDTLRTSQTVDYVSPLLALRIGQEATKAWVRVRDLGSGKEETLTADRVFVACGAMGTTRLVLSSLDWLGRDIEMLESAQFLVPCVSFRSAGDPRESSEFTLNQFNMVLDMDGSGYDMSQIHFYPYNPAFLTALPVVLRDKLPSRVLGVILARLTAGIGYLPSWKSGRLLIRAERSNGGLANVTLRPAPGWSDDSLRFLKSVLRRMRRAAPLLDLWPIASRATVSASGKSYHYGGTLPLGGVSTNPIGTDRLGRLSQWDRIHLIDASVFPTIPATTFSLSIMANARRIATEVLAL